MIPYPLFMFRVIRREKILDIRALEPVKNGFTFRVAQCEREFLEQPGTYVACFLLPQTKTYKEYEVCGNIQKYEGQYAFVSEDEQFLADFQNVLNDYMRMIRIKTENDDLDAMELLADVKLSEKYTEHLREWRGRFCKPTSRRDGLEDSSVHENVTVLDDSTALEFAIVLDYPYLWNLFLANEREAFLNIYLKDKMLNDFPISHRKVTHVYLGSQFCVHLLPEKALLLSLMNRVLMDGMSPVIVLPPIAQGRMEETEQLLLFLDDYAEKNGLCIEVVVNDYGVARCICDLGEQGKVDQKHFKVTAGILLNKRKKDPRFSQVVESGENLLNDSTVTAFFAEKLGIRAVSYESCESLKNGESNENCGGGIIPGELPFVLHMPMYQVNSSDCVLYSLCRYGDRGRKASIEHCPMYCTDHLIVYPENVPLIGIGNSIFGISDMEINDMEYLSGLMELGLQRIVLS